MLLRGVKFAPPALDRADIEATKGRARNSGRSFGGAPLHRNNSQNNGNRGRGNGHINYGADSRPNPFAAFIQPGQGPPPHGGGYYQGRPPPPPAGEWGPPNGQGYNQGPPALPSYGNAYPQRYGPPAPVPPPGQGYTPPGWNAGYAPPPPYGGYNGRR